MNIGAPEFIILAGPISIAVLIITLIDVSRHPDSAWSVSGQSKTTWIVAPIVLLLLCGVGSLIACVMYFLSVRPKVIAAEQAT